MEGLNAEYDKLTKTKLSMERAAERRDATTAPGAAAQSSNANASMFDALLLGSVVRSAEEAELTAQPARSVFAKAESGSPSQRKPVSAEAEALDELLAAKLPAEEADRTAMPGAAPSQVSTVGAIRPADDAGLTDLDDILAAGLRAQSRRKQ